MGARRGTATQIRSAPPDRRARVILGEYTGKFWRLDNKFAPDVVGDGTGPEVGPFTRAQSAFHTRQVIPLCAGRSGEVNKTFMEVIKVLARAASAGELGLSISPLANSEKRGAHTPSCSNSLSAPWAWRLSEGMPCTRWGGYTMCGGHRRRQGRRHQPTTATTSGEPGSTDGRGGSRTTSQRVTDVSNSSATVEDSG